VEIFYRGTRVASHLRARKPYTAVTHAEHRPKAHQAHLEWPPSRLVDWAQKTGRFSAQLFQQILDRYPHPEMRRVSCRSLSSDAAPLSRTRIPVRVSKVKWLDWAFIDARDPIVLESGWLSRLRRYQANGRRKHEDASCYGGHENGYPSVLMVPNAVFPT
jgi:hypothetical protein